ncbi:MAG: hypothetical protein U1E42_14105 [Rhodospirillales bacterium]
MQRQRAFELYVLRQQDWEIESVFNDRASALATARSLHEDSPGLTLRLVDETFDPDSGDTSSQIIFQATASSRAVADEPRRRGSTPAPIPRPVAKKAAERQMSFVGQVMLRVLGLGAAGFLLLTAFSYLPRILH